jgi:hypothetical protein
MERSVRTAIIAAMLAACACATVESRCAKLDWRALGVEDGQAGEPESAFERRCGRCSGEAFAASYAEGRSEGLKSYCRPENAFAVGARGEPYHGVCGVDAGASFAPHYARGVRLFESERKAIAARQAESDLKAERWAVERRIMEAETAIAATVTKREDRAELRARLKDLRAELAALAGAASALAERRQASETEFAAARAQSAPGPAVTPTLASY